MMRPLLTTLAFLTIAAGADAQTDRASAPALMRHKSARVLFVGAHGANLAIQVTVTAHLEGYPDAMLIFTKEAPITHGGPAYFDFGGRSDMQLTPIAGSEDYAVTFHGPFGAWLASQPAH